MNMAWKEMKKNKVRFLILGSIVFLVSLLTFIISGLANGLSQDNASLIKDMPEGDFFMESEADKTYNFSSIVTNMQQEIVENNKDAILFSIQMGYFLDEQEKQRSVAFVASNDNQLLEQPKRGEVILDHSLQEEGVKIGDTIANDQWNKDLQVTGFVEQQKFNHSAVAFINKKDYQEIYHTEDIQLAFIPEESTTGTAPYFNELESFDKGEFLNTIPSYNAEQLSLNMIVIFLIVISGMLFAIFFYMINVQKIGLYGILKAIGVKTGALFRMMWTQMLIITTISLAVSIGLSHAFQIIAPRNMPFHLTLESTILLSIVFLFIGFIGSTLSGIQIKRVEPLQAIQQGEM
ncbi:ABC transporter permease [Oceanobacillus iheyensis]|uniref:ABC transporter permease n=1 Tax=Oceanobacillus iheyensis TaxID=182710 RepID=UPI00363BF3EC